MHVALLLDPGRPEVRLMPPVALGVRDVIRLHDALNYDGGGLDIVVDDLIAECAADLLEYERPTMKTVSLTRRTEPRIALLLSPQQTALEVPATAHDQACLAALVAVRRFCLSHASGLVLGSRTPANVAGVLLMYAVTACGLVLVGAWAALHVNNAPAAGPQAEIGWALLSMAPLAMVGLHLSRREPPPPVALHPPTRQPFLQRWNVEISLLTAVAAVVLPAVTSLF